MNQYPYQTPVSSSYIPNIDLAEEPIVSEVVEDTYVAADVEEVEDQDVADDEVADDETVASSNGKKSAAPAVSAARPSRALIRKVVAKALEVETTPESTRALAASLLGCSSDTVELTTAIMTAGRGAAQPLADISEVATALIEEAWEAGIIATSLDAARQRGVWALLHARGAVTSSTLPKSLPKAGSAIVKAINSLDATDKAGLAEAGELLKRS